MPEGDVLFALQHQALQNSPKYGPMYKDMIGCPNKIFHLDKAHVVIFPMGTHDLMSVRLETG